MRVRGLKQDLYNQLDRAVRSHPMRVRGLKLEGFYLVKSILVAPHAGAWIETASELKYTSELKVAPHAGAWIETKLCSCFRIGRLVAPHAGAWIETR